MSQSATTVTHAEGMVARVTYFNRRFMAETGFAPIDYFIHMKINKAAIYFFMIKISISQIASKLKFNRSNYFSHTFTEIVGISAREFRNQDSQLLIRTTYGKIS